MSPACICKTGIRFASFRPVHVYPARKARRAFCDNKHSDYDVLISTGTNEILDLAKPRRDASIPPYRILCPGALNKDKNQKLLVDAFRTIAAGLRKLMTDVAYRESLGESARAYCAEHYSREKILDQWDGVLREVVMNEKI